MDARKSEERGHAVNRPGLDGRSNHDEGNREHALSNFGAAHLPRGWEVWWKCRCGAESNFTGLDRTGATIAILHLLDLAFGTGEDDGGTGLPHAAPDGPQNW